MRIIRITLLTALFEIVERVNLRPVRLTLGAARGSILLMNSSQMPIAKMRSTVAKRKLSTDEMSGDGQLLTAMRIERVMQKIARCLPDDDDAAHEHEHGRRQRADDGKDDDQPRVEEECLERDSSQRCTLRMGIFAEYRLTVVERVTFDVAGASKEFEHLVHVLRDLRSSASPCPSQCSNPSSTAQHHARCWNERAIVTADVDAFAEHGVASFRRGECGSDARPALRGGTRRGRRVARRRFGKRSTTSICVTARCVFTADGKARLDDARPSRAGRLAVFDEVRDDCSVFRCRVRAREVTPMDVVASGLVERLLCRP